MFTFFQAIEIPTFIAITVWVIRETGMTLDTAIRFFDYVISLFARMLAPCYPENLSPDSVGKSVES